MTKTTAKIITALIISAMTESETANHPPLLLPLLLD
jgi:hypothetical protein